MMTRSVLTLLIGFLDSFGALASLSDLSARESSCKPTSETTKRCRLKGALTVNFSEGLNKHGIQKLNVSCGITIAMVSVIQKKMKISEETHWMGV